MNAQEWKTLRAEVSSLTADSDGDIRTRDIPERVRRVHTFRETFENKNLVLNFIDQEIEHMRAEETKTAEKGEKMSKITKAQNQIVSTGKAVAAAAEEGAKQGSAKKSAKVIVTVARSRFGEHYPKVLNTELGRKVEPVLLAAGAHFLAGMFPDRVPYAEGLQTNCERVVTGVSADAVEELLEVFEPMIVELAGKFHKLDGDGEK